MRCVVITDVDCGGGSCRSCSEDAVCDQSADCASGLCFARTCRSPYPTLAPTPPPSSAPTHTPCEWLDEPPSPRLASAKFSPSGGALWLAFDTPTDRGGKGGTRFACDSLLGFSQVAAATCAWTSDSHLTAELDVSATCTPGDNVTALGDKLKVSWRLCC